MVAEKGEWLHVLQPLWAAWGALAKARAHREPLELELPEKRVVLDEAGRIACIPSPFLLYTSDAADE